MRLYQTYWNHLKENGEGEWILTLPAGQTEASVYARWKKGIQKEKYKDITYTTANPYARLAFEVKLNDKSPTGKTLWAKIEGQTGFTLSAMNNMLKLLEDKKDE